MNYEIDWEEWYDFDANWPWVHKFQAETDELAKEYFQKFKKEREKDRIYTGRTFPNEYEFGVLVHRLRKVNSDRTEIVLCGFPLRDYTLDS